MAGSKVKGNDYKPMDSETVDYSKQTEEDDVGFFWTNGFIVVHGRVILQVLCLDYYPIKVQATCIMCIAGQKFKVANNTPYITSTLL